MTPDELFRRARAVPVEGLIDDRVTLRGRPGDRRGPCPLCGGDKDSTRFSLSQVKNAWRCYGCGEKGGAVEMEVALRGGTALEAARRLTGADLVERPPAKPRPAPKPEPVDTWQKRRAEVAAKLWGEARPARETPVEAWLSARGLDPKGVPGGLDRLRFHPLAVHTLATREDPAVLAPAMIARLYALRDGVLAASGGVHVTYLSRDGRSKAKLEPARRVWGAAGVVPLTDLTDRSLPLVVGEGLETVWTVAERLWLDGRGCRAIAVLSLDRLQGFPLRDRLGRFDPDAPRLDPERPPFTLPDPGPVLILVDHDMSALSVKTRGPLGVTVARTLDAGARARLCAGLAVQAWRAAGASDVQVIAPTRRGRDFNDLVKEGASL